MANPVHESNTFINFFMEAVEIKAESEKAGRPVYKEIPHIRIQVPGDRNNITISKVTDYHKNRYPRAWAIFEAGQKEEAVSGTPLSNWPQITRSQAKEAEYYGVQTVEQLAEISDLNCQKLGMGFMTLRDKAKAYIQVANDSAAINAQAEETQRLRNELEAMKAQLAAVSESAIKPRGRPKTETVEA